ncbi:hypothetical protein B0H10DRAFT_2229002 [Mycena sp. CBHHK59/15]|nr:hypothetical protein B0H10DRAFT_2229002 [Mycena sp. CBHHK59/15]
MSTTKKPMLSFTATVFCGLQEDLHTTIKDLPIDVSWCRVLGSLEQLKRFVRAAITCWGTHALSTRRLLDLKTFLVDLVNHRSEDLRLAGGSDEDSIAAATVQELPQNQSL